MVAAGPRDQPLALERTGRVVARDERLDVPEVVPLCVYVVADLLEAAAPNENTRSPPE